MIHQVEAYHWANTEALININFIGERAWATLRVQQHCVYHPLSLPLANLDAALPSLLIGRSIGFDSICDEIQRNQYPIPWC